MWQLFAVEPRIDRQGGVFMIGEFGRFIGCQRGTTAMEYAFIAGLVSIGIIGALGAMSGSITGLFNTISSTMSGSAGG
jgi:pilus assembly protein Flp/PilA